MKERLYIGLLMIALLTVQGMATEYGADLLSGDGDFEDGSTGPWTCTAEVNEISAVSTTLPCLGSYSWQAGPTSATKKNFYAAYNISDTNGIPIVGNREYRFFFHYRVGSSVPSYFGIILGPCTTIKQTSWSRSAWYSKTITYVTGAQETEADLKLAMRSDGYGVDSIYIDDINFCQERTYPMVGGDSTQGQIVNGRANSVTFDRIIMPGCTTTKAGIDGTITPKIAFDPDIAITATNATVSNVAWISDDQVSADIVPSATGTITLTFTNVYSNYSYEYTMTSITAPTACGGSGTIYLSGDINHDCKVNFLDFAELGLEWAK